MNERSITMRSMLATGMFSLPTPQQKLNPSHKGGKPAHKRNRLHMKKKHKIDRRMKANG